MTKAEVKYAWGWAAALMALSCLPYLIVWWFTPLGSFFPGTLYTSDDHGVYFAWMRQATDGKLVFQNLFTTEPQRATYFHLFFLALGWLSKVPGLDIPTAYHLGRVVFGALTLALVYRLGAFFTPDVSARRCIFWTAALSSGLGWLFWQDHTSPALLPVDVWQAEALIPTSLYVNALYAVSLALMLGFVVCLLLAEERGARWAVGAGACGLLLGNIHSYDVIHLAALCAVYLLLRWIIGRRFPTAHLKLAVIAGAVTAPTVLYMFWLYQTEPVFRSRADTATLSFGLGSYLLGFGLLLPLAAWGAVILWRREAGPDDRLRRLLPMGWAVVGIAVAYAPFAFQRKMIMGEHIALSLLAGLAVAEIGRLAGSKGRLAGVLAASAAVAALSITTVRWTLRDVRMAREENLTSTLAHPAYWPLETIQTFEWVGKNSPPNAALMTMPINGVLAPAYSGRRVWAGHWGETPGYNDRFEQAFSFYAGRMTSQERQDFLRGNRITHVILSSMEREMLAAARDRAQAGGAFVPPPRPLDGEPFLREVHRQGETVIYEVRG